MLLIWSEFSVKPLSFSSELTFLCLSPCRLSSGLPPDISTEEFVQLMSKCGIVMRDPVTEEYKVKLYKDREGNLKGDGLCCYLKVSLLSCSIFFATRNHPPLIHNWGPFGWCKFLHQTWHFFSVQPFFYMTCWHPLKLVPGMSCYVNWQSGLPFSQIGLPK